MALQWVEKDLQLSLDDFIPPHLQRKSRSSNKYTEDQVRVRLMLQEDLEIPAGF